ncbi:mucin-associated surface protein (MASP) [Trypanosoma cruzi]|nr:mucin-associated surface protein (MASP) [Trypanosoma cruzi]
MAMMMTGRVLLVCVLCVLWCVTVFGDARDNRCVEGEKNFLTHTKNGGNDRVRLTADCELISTRMGLIKAVEAGEREEESESDNAPLEKTEKSAPGTLLAVTEGNAAPGPKEGKGAAGAATPSPSGPGVPGTGDETRQLTAAGQKGSENKNVDPNNKASNKSQDQHTDQLPSSPGSSSTRSDEKSSLTGTDEINQLPNDTETKGDASRQDTNGSDEAIEKEDGEKEKEKNKKKHITTRETRGSK